MKYARRLALENPTGAGLFKDPARMKLALLVANVKSKHEKARDRSSLIIIARGMQLLLEGKITAEMQGFVDYLSWAKVAPQVLLSSHPKAFLGVEVEEEG